VKKQNRLSRGVVSRCCTKLEPRCWCLLGRSSAPHTENFKFQNPQGILFWNSGVWSLKSNCFYKTNNFLGIVYICFYKNQLLFRDQTPEFQKRIPWGFWNLKFSVWGALNRPKRHQQRGSNFVQQRRVKDDFFSLKIV
jgi:hypothetical protein